VLTQLAAAQQSAQAGQQAVVVALALRAVIGVDRRLHGCAVDSGREVLGVAHAGGGQLGQCRLNCGAQLGGDVATQRRHPVGLLVAQRQTAPAGTIVVGEGSVGVEAVGEFVGQLG
jgi:hypothetical protein